MTSVHDLESRVASLEARLARWRLVSVVLAMAAGAAAWAAGRAFPPDTPTPDELLVTDGHHTATLRPDRLTLETPHSRATLSVDDGLALDGVTLKRGHLGLRNGDVASSLSADKLSIYEGDAELVRLAQGIHGGELTLRHASGAEPVTAVLGVDANTARLDLIHSDSGGLRLSQSKMPLLCSDPPTRTPGAPDQGGCADLRDLARLARPSR